MKILFDHGTPVPLRDELTEHQVDTAYEKGWANVKNSKLLDRAVKNRYDLLITTDQNLCHQQNLTKYNIAVLVLTSASWPQLQKQIGRILKAIDQLNAGEYVVVTI